MSTELINMLHRTLSVMVGLPFAFQLWIFVLCTSYKRAAANIHTTNKEIFRSIKLRYTNSSKLNIPLSDTDSFVSKYFYGNGGPFKLVSRIERTSCILLCITLLSTTALYVRDLTDTSHMVAIIAASICFYIFRSALSTERQMSLTVAFTRDYLENTLKNHLNPDKFRTRNNKNDTNDSSKIKDVVPSNSNITKDISETIKNDDSEIIEAVLREFLA